MLKSIGKKLPILDRLQSILNVERSLLENQNELAHAITSEMGKPIREAKAEIEKSARLCRYYFENALELLPEFNYSFGKRTAQVVFNPLGGTWHNAMELSCLAGHPIYNSNIVNGKCRFIKTCTECDSNSTSVGGLGFSGSCGS